MEIVRKVKIIIGIDSKGNAIHCPANTECLTHEGTRMLLLGNDNKPFDISQDNRAYPILCSKEYLHCVIKTMEYLHCQDLLDKDQIVYLKILSNSLTVSCFQKQLNYN